MAGRAQTLTNRARTTLLLRLLVAGRRGLADQQLWAERIRTFLADIEGHAPEQRTLTNHKGITTL